TAEAEKKAAAAEQQRAEAEERAKNLKDLQQKVTEFRSEISNLELVLTDITAARASAAKLNNSEVVESQLKEIRGSLGRGFAKIEQQLESALPDLARKGRVYIFIGDEEQRAAAKQLKTELESNGFDVPAIAKVSARRIDAT